MKEIGWIQSNQDVAGLFQQQSSTTTAGKPSSQSGRGGRKGGYNDKTMGADSVPAAVGITYNPGRPNPFFAGAALQGGPLAQQQQGTSGSRSDYRRRGGHNINSTNNKGKPSNRGSGNSSNSGSRQQQERPEKKDTRTHAYRKR